MQKTAIRTHSPPRSNQVAEHAASLKPRPYGIGILDTALAAPAAPVQALSDRDLEPTAAVREAAAHGIAGGGARFPFLDTIQRSFGGHDVSGLVAHTGASAQAASRSIGASAYAMGDHVAFAGAPSLHLAAHEAAHTIQQRAGVHLPGGVGKVGDPYEQHADAVADAVVSGQSAAPLLDQVGGGGGQPAVQMGGFVSPPTGGGGLLGGLLGGKKGGGLFGGMSSSVNRGAVEQALNFLKMGTMACRFAETTLQSSLGGGGGRQY